MKKEFIITNDSTAFFNNKVDFCVGTGRMGLALQKEYFEQLKLVQEEIGFKYIRGHGLFTDDMAIYQEYVDEDGTKYAEYNFTYFDMVMDNYRELSIRPFFELGFMPNKLASGDQAVFYWRGNVTPPANYGDWCKLVQAMLRHVIERYGIEYAISLPIEVWNEPNLGGFWKGADMQEYFNLFKHTFHAVKEVDERFRVGGPAICGVDDANWIRSFMQFCRDEKIALDFVTRHHYTSELPVRGGHYSYIKLMDPEFGFENLKSSRDIIDGFDEYKGMEIHITEFNTSYTPNAIIHDTNKNAAFIAHQLSRLGDVNASYSYWTFGDIFEEMGVPFTPFHGGFGLVANGCIPKPTFWTMKFFKDLGEGGTCVHRSDDAVVVRQEDGSYRGVAWNKTMEDKGEYLELAFDLDMDSGAAEYGVTEYGVIRKVVDEDGCNPLKIWHSMGEPSSLGKAQKKLLQEGARPVVGSDRGMLEDGTAKVRLGLGANAVVYFEVFVITGKGDRGYDYERGNL